MSNPEEEKLSLLPKPATQKEQFPPPCSVATYYPDILLRNDGFNAEVAYTFDGFYAHGANILGNMVRMQVDGAVLQLLTDERGERMINVLYLYDARRQLTNSFSLSPHGEFKFHQTRAGELSILHQHPELWSYEGNLPNGRKVKFTPVFDIPVNFTADAAQNEGAESRNLDAPTMVIAYGRRGIIDYAYGHYINPPKPKELNTLPDGDIIDALRLIVCGISAKWDQLLPDNDKRDPEIELR